MPHSLSCHCKTIRLEVDAPLEKLLQCNCSTCSRFGAIHWYVPAKSVRLLDQCRVMSSYVFRFVHESHQFCPTCGTSILRTGYPDGVVAINAALVEDIDIFELDVERFDGRREIPAGPDQPVRT